MKTKKQLIKKLVKEIFKENENHMQHQIDKALNSGALNIDDWDENNNFMILPKTIAIAILEDSADGLKGHGTSFEKQMTKDINNLKLFL